MIAKRTKVAFVSQPVDSVLPPYQNSVGLCTYELSRALAPYYDEVVYGQKASDTEVEEISSDGVRFRFFPAKSLEASLVYTLSRLAQYGVPIEPASSARWSHPGYGRKVAEDAAREHSDIVHLQHCSQYAPTIRALNPATKIVLQLHAEWFSQNNLSEIERRLRHVDFVLTVSDYIKAKTIQQIPTISNRIATLYNGIPIDEFNREPDFEGRRQRKEKRIFYCGALSPHKGVHVLVEAFKLIAREFPDARLEIAGFTGVFPLSEVLDRHDRAGMAIVRPWYDKEYRARIKMKLGLPGGASGSYPSQIKSTLPKELEGRVSFLEMLSRADLIKHYYNADIFAFCPIWDEGFGIPPIEAMAAGIPVVASRSGAIPETVRDGETGILVPKADASGTAQAIATLLKNASQCEAMGRAGRKRVFENFTWNHAAERLRTVYQSIS